MDAASEHPAPLSTPLLHADTGASQPAAGHAPHAPSLKSVARSVMLAQRFARPPEKSSKGVPLLQHDALLSMFSGSGDAEEGGARSGAGCGVRPQALAMAVQFVSDALAGRSPNTRLAGSAGVTGVAAFTPSSPLEQILHHWVYAGALQLIVTLHCILAFFEANPPATGAPPFSWHVGACEAVFIAVYLVDVACVAWAMGWHHFLDKRWESVFAVIAALSTLDWLLYYPCGLRNMWRFSRPLRPLLGIAKVKSLRRLLTSIVWTIPALVDMSALLFVAIFFYATLGVQLFNRGQVPDYSTGNDHFDDWTSATLAIYILSTTENYPNVANPAYHYRPYVAGLFFVTALFCVLWLALPLVLARVYDHYKEVHVQMARAKRVKQYTSLVFAYQTIMAGDGELEMQRGVFQQLVQAVKPGLSAKQSSLMFDVLDIDRSGAITISEFLRLPAVLALKFPWADADEPGPGEGDEPSSARKTDFDRLWSRSLRTCRLVAHSKWFAIVAGAVIVFACISGSLWTVNGQKSYDACRCMVYSEPNDDDTHVGGGSSIASPPTCIPGRDCSSYLVHVADALGLLFSLLQGVELAIRAIAHDGGKAPASTTPPSWFARAFGGLRRSWFLASGWNVMATVIVAFNIVSAPVLLVGPAMSPGIADVFESSRALRFLRLLELLPRLRSSVSIVVGILPLVLRFTIVYCGISYAFALVGMSIVGAVPNTLPLLCQNCQLYAFNTLVEAWLALLQLTVGNNWNSILYPLIDGTSWWAAWYFIVYRFTMTDAIMSLIEGVMIEAYEAAQDAAAAEKEQTRLAAEIDGGVATPSSPVSSATLRPRLLVEKLPVPSTQRAAEQWQRELYADVAAAELQVGTPLPAGQPSSAPAGEALRGGDHFAAIPTSAAAAAAPSIGLPEISSGNGGRVFVGVSVEELALLEQALRSQEARLERQQQRRAAAAAAVTPASPRSSRAPPGSPAPPTRRPVQSALPLSPLSLNS